MERLSLKYNVGIISEVGCDLHCVNCLEAVVISLNRSYLGRRIVAPPRRSSPIIQRHLVLNDDSRVPHESRVGGCHVLCVRWVGYRGSSLPRICNPVAYHGNGCGPRDYAWHNEHNLRCQLLELIVSIEMRRYISVRLYLDGRHLPCDSGVSEPDQEGAKGLAEREGIK